MLWCCWVDSAEFEWAPRCTRCQTRKKKGPKGAQRHKQVHGIGFEKRAIHQDSDDYSSQGQEVVRTSLFARLLFLLFSFGGLICILQGMHLGFADPRAWKEYGSKQA